MAHGPNYHPTITSSSLIVFTIRVWTNIRSRGGYRDSPILSSLVLCALLYSSLSFEVFTVCLTIITSANMFSFSRHCSWPVCIILVNYFYFSYAFQALTTRNLDSSLTLACKSALTADIACSPVVARFQKGSYYAESTLTDTCTTACAAALDQYYTNVNSACGIQTWNGYEDTEMPLLIIPDMMKYQYSLACLTDGGRFCNNVAAEAAYVLDPGSEYSSE